MSEHRPLRLGFARGMAPGKWAKRWQQAVGEPLQLVPLGVTYGRDHRPIDGGPVDVMLERTRPGDLPEGTASPEPTRHAVRLYIEAVALVVAADHELAGEPGIDAADLALVRLMDHGDHLEQWPAAEPAADPSWRPRNAAAALAVVATGAGAILLPLPLARQLSSRKEHAVLPVTGDTDLEGGVVWASWDLTRDASDVQQLAGIMRGRTARSSRTAASTGDGGSDSAPGVGEAAEQRAKRKPPRPATAASKKAGPKPGSRGAQLAAAKAKAERKKAEKRQAAGRKKR
ncbi:LysR substrate-binding domain-containing protein [Leucobacter sp. gxy201]|uniref:LysR substrate-binding domain-containing protein n=1 Tax=Leucobacter sp. gxy201 TaxID=2957200 RepID=UPI003DA187F8